MKIELYNSECLEKLKELPDNSVDCIVTDPPYFISFMNKGWDKEDSIASKKEFWAECLRVTKEGGYLLAFGHSRTHHRLFTAVEDGGWEIRDTLMWLHGQGFPKGENLKPAHEPICMARKGKGNNNLNINDCRVGNEKIIINKLESWSGFGEIKKPDYVSTTSIGRFPANVILDEEAGEILDKQSGITKSVKRSSKNNNLNIDACRIACNDKSKFPVGNYNTDTTIGKIRNKIRTTDSNPESRFPANIILDEEAGKILDKQTDSASRFFYCAKVSSKERGEGNTHPTVKPQALMEYLIKLVSKEEGTILDPFMGSGSTGIAAKKLNRNFIGIEMDEGYYTIASKRIGK